MKPTQVLILGVGHLAFRVRRCLEQCGYVVLHKPEGISGWGHDLRSPTEKAALLFAGIDVKSLAMVYVLDENDDRSLELIMALMVLYEDLPITASLYNENIIAHLEAARRGLRILNPARIAAPAFVAALDQQVTRVSVPKPEIPKAASIKRRRRRDLLVPLLVGAFHVMVLGAIVFFHYQEGMSWIDSLYFVVVTVATVGYGDINLLESTLAGRLFGIALIMASTVFIWLIFSLTINYILKARTELALGHRRYRYRKHIILCGLGRLGFFIAQELQRRGEKFIVIEINEHAPQIEYLRNQGIEVYIGNARLSGVLQRTNAAHARAVISVIDNDLGNLEIGLNARSLQPELRLILRVFDDAMAQVLKEKLGIYLSLSTSAVADKAFVRLLTGDDLPLKGR